MISPLAYVDPSAKIGKNVTIHPFAYIDKNVEIGDDNVIMPNASIMSGARIGNGNTIYNGAVIAATPQDFKYEGVSKCTPSVFYAQSPDFHKLGLCYYLKILYL